MTIPKPTLRHPFTDFARQGRAIPGDYIADQFSETHRAVDQVIDALAQPPRPESIPLSSLDPAAVLALTEASRAKVRAEIEAAQAELAAVLADVALAKEAAAKAARDAVRAEVAAQAATHAAAMALARAHAIVIDADNVQAAAAGFAQSLDSQQDASLLSAASAENWSVASWQWAEYMGGPLPADTVALMGISGDHWSSRWWANQASQYLATASGLYVAKAGSTMTGPLVLSGDPTAPNGAATKSYVDAHAGIPDAPNDGQQYARKNLAWTAVVATGGGGIAEAPADGQLYSRQGSTGSWQVSPGGAGGGISEAPNDGALYGRQSLGWQKGVKVSGDTMTGHLSLPISPSAANAVRKDYVDAADATKANTVHSHVSTDITDFAEATDDRVAALLVAGTNVTLSYNDAAGSLTVSSTGGGGLTDAASDGKLYGRLNAAWVQGVKSSGDIMTGALSLPNSGSVGATMLNFGTAGTGIYGTATGFVVAVGGVAQATYTGGVATLNGTQWLPATGSATTPILNFGTGGTGLYGDTTTVRVATSGSLRATFGTSFTLTTPIVLPAGSAGTVSQHFGTVNTGAYGSATQLFWATAGTLRATLDSTALTLAVPCVLPADPTTAMQATTKQYVDARPAVASMSDTAPSSPVNGQLWCDTTTMNLFVYYNDGNTSQWVQVGGA